MNNLGKISMEKDGLIDGMPRDELGHAVVPFVF